MKYSTIFVLLFLLVLFLISFPLVDKGNIFSNIFVDSYSPRKVLIVERNPIRIVLFGEFLDEEVVEDDDDLFNKDSNKTVPYKTSNGLINIIRELRMMESEPKYPLNSVTEIHVNSKLTGDRNRGASKSVVVQASDGKMTEIQTEGEPQQ